MSRTTSSSLQSPKEIAAGIFWLGHAIGVKEKAVAWVDGHVADGIIGLRYDSENYAIAFDALQLPSPPRSRGGCPAAEYSALPFCVSINK